MSFFSDDSHNLIQRSYYTAEQAEKDLGVKFLGSEVALGINQQLCVQGLIMSHKEENIAVKSLGVSFSHPLACT